MTGLQGLHCNLWYMLIKDVSGAGVCLSWGMPVMYNCSILVWAAFVVVVAVPSNLTYLFLHMLLVEVCHTVIV